MKRCIYFNDRVYNIPVKKDVWDEDRKRIKARNFFIIAPTGEGKSVLANHIFRQFYEKIYGSLSLTWGIVTESFHYCTGGYGLHQVSGWSGDRSKSVFVENVKNISAAR